MYIIKRNYRTNVRRFWEIPGNVFNAILGSLLTKNSVERRSPEYNSRLVYSVGDRRYLGLDVMWRHLENYSTTDPVVFPAIHPLANGKQFLINRFKTGFLPCFNRFHELFYVNGEKRIPVNIVELMNAEVLAYWFLFSGSKYDNHIIFFTEHLREGDTDLLVGAQKKLGIVAFKSPVRFSEGFRLYIGYSYIEKFNKLVEPYVSTF